MICQPCREPHHAQECVDNAVTPARRGLDRWCYCQHAPRSDGRVPAPSVALGEGGGPAPGAPSKERA